LFGHLEPHRHAGLFLAHRCALDGVAVRRNILHLESDNIATAQLAVDRKIEHRRSRLRSAIWSLVRIDQTCLGRSGGLAPISLPLFQAARFGAALVSLSCMVILLACENDQHGLNASAPGRQSASGFWGAPVAAAHNVR
jgi:hypothetical protein